MKIAYPARRVLNWRRAEVHWNKRRWEDTHADAKNIVTIHLSMNHPQDYAFWNDLVDSAKEHMKDIFYPAVEAFAQQHDLARRFIANVEWDVLLAIMEAAYADCDLPTTFYLEPLKVYEAGHMPCGWEHGEWPTGTLIVH